MTSRSGRRLLAAALALGCGALAAAGWLSSTVRAPALPSAGNPVRAEASRDLWISAAGGEAEGNNGGARRLKLKGIVEFFLIDFDPAPFRGKRVTRARLHLHLEGPETLGRVTVSSVPEAWVEGSGSRYATVHGASSFLWARTGERRWAGNGPDITEVVLGHGGSAWGFADASPRDALGWQEVELAPEVVQARLDGRSQGFFVMDDVGHEYTREGNAFHYRVFPNRYLTSREGGAKTAPYFTLWLADEAPASASPGQGDAAPTRDATAVLPNAGPPRPGPRGAPALPLFDQFGEPLRELELQSARNEAIGFIVEAPMAEVQPPELPGLEVSLFDVGLVGGRRDPLVPPGWSIPASVEPQAGEATPGTAAPPAATYVEIYVPKDATSGLREATLRARGRGVPLSLRVWSFTLPDRLSFVPQMNCYGLPGHEAAYYRLAHEHRTALNCLGYGWWGQITGESAPVKRPDGSFDWTTWDKRFGPLLDGSAFRGGRRDGVPVESMYLPLNENWPMDHESHFKGGYWVESAYDDGYWRELRDAAQRFARHFEEKGYRETVFEFYLNNKISYKQTNGNRWNGGSAAWLFDEPVNTQDFWALRRFGLEFLRGAFQHPRARMAFRVDVSSPQWQRDLLDGVSGVEVVGGAMRDYAARVAGRARSLGHSLYMYGTASPPGGSSAMPAAWCVETWALGGDGVLPWQTIGTPESWRAPDALALFYPTPAGPVPSLRLKAFRAGQQLVEYLTLYAALSGRDRAALGAEVLRDASLRALSERASADDAGSSRFEGPTARALATLRTRLGVWLDARAPAPRERWYDPRPAPRDPARVPERRALTSGGGNQAGAR